MFSRVNEEYSLQLLEETVNKRRKMDLGRAEEHQKTALMFRLGHLEGIRVPCWSLS